MDKRRILFTMPDSALLDLPVPVAVVCHDAGAANIILSWMRAHAVTHAQAARDWRLLAQGPAAKLWAERSVPLARLCQNIDEALEGAAVLLSGTGWASDLEHEARRQAKVRGIKTIAVIDHWVNYKERFIRQGEIVLPDEIYVTDDYAFREAERCFPDLPMQIKPNLYLDESVSQISPLPCSENEVLYVLEPIRADWCKQPAGEFQALDYFVANIDKLGITREAKIRLRPHPSDAPGKYDEWLASHHELNAVLDDSPTLVSAIGKAAWVAGCETYAMVVALLAGKKVVSTLPPWAHRCRLPHSAITSLRDLE